MLLKELIEICKDCDIYVLEKVKTRDYDFYIAKYVNKIKVVIKTNELKYYKDEFLNSKIISIIKFNDGIGVFLEEEC